MSKSRGLRRRLVERKLKLSKIGLLQDSMAIKRRQRRRRLKAQSCTLTSSSSIQTLGLVDSKEEEHDDASLPAAHVARVARVARVAQVAEALLLCNAQLAVVALPLVSDLRSSLVLRLQEEINLANLAHLARYRRIVELSAFSCAVRVVEKNRDQQVVVTGTGTLVMDWAGEPCIISTARVLRFIRGYEHTHSTSFLFWVPGQAQQFPLFFNAGYGTGVFSMPSQVSQAMPMSCYDLALVRGPVVATMLSSIKCLGEESGFGNLCPAQVPRQMATFCTLGSSLKAVLIHNGCANAVSRYCLQVKLFNLAEDMFAKTQEPSLLSCKVNVFEGASGGSLFGFSSEFPRGMLIGVLSGRRTVFEDLTSDEEQAVSSQALFVNDVALIDLMRRADSSASSDALIKSPELHVPRDVFMYRLSSPRL